MSSQAFEAAAQIAVLVQGTKPNLHRAELYGSTECVWKHGSTSEIQQPPPAPRRLDDDAFSWRDDRLTGGVAG